MPNLPVVIGELTGPWVQAPDAWAHAAQAQAAAAARPEFQGNVLFVETHDFVRKPEDSPNPGHGHHEFGNAETYFLVGDALGKGMVKLLDANRSTGTGSGQRTSDGRPCRNRKSASSRSILKACTGISASATSVFLPNPLTVRAWASMPRSGR